MVASSLISLLVVVLVVCIILWLINTFVAVDASIKRAINVIAIVILFIYALATLFGLPHVIR